MKKKEIERELENLYEEKKVMNQKMIIPMILWGIFILFFMSSLPVLLVGLLILFIFTSDSKGKRKKIEHKIDIFEEMLDEDG